MRARDFRQPPVVAVRRRDDPDVPAAGDRRWPASVPAVTQLLPEGLDLAPGVTFLELVEHWRSYLASPERYLRHLLE